MDRASENDTNQKEYQCTHCGKIGTKISRSKILLKKSKRENEEKKIYKERFQQHSWTLHCKSFMNNLEDPMKMNVGHFKRFKRHHHALENGPCQGYRDEINQDSKTL